MNTAVNWFEIPAENFERAVRFYSKVFAKELTTLEAGERRLALLPAGSNLNGSENPGGSILHMKNFKPSREGTIVYLEPGEDLDMVLGRVEPAGGKIDTPKSRIGTGYLATFVDSEGNMVGLVQWDKPSNL